MISSLSMDLKRVAIGYHRGSNKMAERFMHEALKRQGEVKLSEVKPYLRKFIKLLPEILNKKDKKRVAEDALMYSTIFQNYTLKY
ncbi:MAG: hypothetical protein ACC618_03185 [Patescibacteria group bacterium]